MGYYAGYSGVINCKERLPEEIFNEFSEYFENVYYNENTKELTMDGFDKYYPDSVKEILCKIAPYCESICVDYNGEDNSYWRFVLEHGELTEDNGLVFYESDLSYANQNRDEFLGQIIDVIQDCLDNPEGKTIEGVWYDKIHDELESIMKSWKVFQ